MEKPKANYNFVKGGAKEAPFSTDGTRIRISLLLDNLLELVEQHPDLHPKGYVNIELVKRAAKDTYGNTHMVIESTFKPGEKKEVAARPTPQAAAPQIVKEKQEDDLPF
jgi:hypothetical protein